jgi:transcriptional regulator with XRE-family HTH domain
MPSTPMDNFNNLVGSNNLDEAPERLSRDNPTGVTRPQRKNKVLAKQEERAAAASAEASAKVPATPADVSHTESITPPAEAAPVEISQEAKDREERRVAFKELQRAKELKAQAEKLNASGATIAKLQKEYAENPTYETLSTLSKAVGLSPEEFMRKTNAAILNQPSQKEPTPEEKQRKAEEDWKQEQIAWRNQQTQEMNYIKKQSYINGALLPILVKDKDKYETIHLHGVDAVMDDVYSQMNEDYSLALDDAKANGVDPATVAKPNPEEYLQFVEDELFTDYKTRYETASKLKKLSGGVKQDNVLNSEAPEKIAAPTPKEPVAKTEEDKLADKLLSEAKPEVVKKRPATKTFGGDPVDNEGIRRDPNGRFSRAERMKRITPRA